MKQGDIQVLLKSGQTVTLTPSQIAQIDPLGIGETAYMANYLKQFPAGNNPLLSPDLGLNFNTLTFNAPQDLNNHAQVAKLDYNIDTAGKHTVSLRGTLNGASVDGNGQVGSTTGLAQFPGQAAIQETLDNSRGLGGALYGRSVAESRERLQLWVYPAGKCGHRNGSGGADLLFRIARSEPRGRLSGSRRRRTLPMT